MTAPQKSCKNPVCTNLLPADAAPQRKYCGEKACTTNRASQRGRKRRKNRIKELCSGGHTHLVGRCDRCYVHCLKPRPDYEVKPRGRGKPDSGFADIGFAGGPAAAVESAFRPREVDEDAEVNAPRSVAPDKPYFFRRGTFDSYTVDYRTQEGELKSYVVGAYRRLELPTTVSAASAPRVPTRQAKTWDSPARRFPPDSPPPGVPSTRAWVVVAELELAEQEETDAAGAEIIDFPVPIDLEVAA